jgi:RNA polymerase subunit RPABC4/transcription elongation factor Spt4
MKCPNCGSDDIEWSGTIFDGKVYGKACNKCGERFRVFQWGFLRTCVGG